MSAREWFKCPFCKSDMQKAKEEYGKIPLDKFLDKYKKSLVSVDYESDEDDPEDIETVRMDGEEWLGDDGFYYVEHSMNCNNCGRSWSINVKVSPTMSEKNGASKLTFKVPSSSGKDDHEVGVENGVYTCDCVGFKTRKHCSHIEKIKKDIEKQ
jgi:hypothetical protein